MHAGPEIGVASTKSFTSQVTTLVLMALSIGKLKKSISDDEFQIISKELFSISEKIQSSLDSINKQTRSLAKLYKNAKNFLYLGRGISFPCNSIIQ